ncbi:MAG: hypothetical protein WD989_02520 [Candidatus Paceibacterota bacterium]
MKKVINKFWFWYEENLHLNIGIAAILFSWQLIHLLWLTTNVVLPGTLDYGFSNLGANWELLIILVDYTEIPALIAVSLVYMNELRARRDIKKSVMFLVLLNSQWLHLFWITDEFVIKQFKDTSDIILPVWLAWTAIGIDYLELPVMYDTMKKFSLLWTRR